MAYKSSETTNHNIKSFSFFNKTNEAETLLKKCGLCPRKCKVNRTDGETGFCKTKDKPFISSWGPHFGEEKPLVGKYGSGTIFFGNCNLGCILCQNYSISHMGEGEEISFEKLASIMLELQSMRCHNINLVTPTHQVPMILKSIDIAIAKGLNIPIVYNCGGYESLETIKLLEGVVDIYMPDFKYSDPDTALKYSDAKDYPENAKTAIKEMHRQVGDLVINENGIATKGLLVRHLILPDGIAGTQEVIRFISEEISKNTYINIMDQYHPCYKAFDIPSLNRRITEKEYNDTIKIALKSGLTRIDNITV